MESAFYASFCVSGSKLVDHFLSYCRSPNATEALCTIFKLCLTQKSTISCATLKTPLIHCLVTSHAECANQLNPLCSWRCACSMGFKAPTCFCADFSFMLGSWANRRKLIEERCVNSSCSSLPLFSKGKSESLKVCSFQKHFFFFPFLGGTFRKLQ